jgi:hypothetical protein
LLNGVLDISLTAMKRGRDDGDADASSDDEIGPMPVPDAQSVKKKRKGMSSYQFSTNFETNCG